MARTARHPLRPLFDFSGSSAASVFGVPVFGASSGKWWHSAFVRPAYRMGNRIHRAIWRARHRIDPRHRYHVVDTGLRPGYHDPEILMLHASFALLRRHVEGRMGGIAALEAFTEGLRGRPDPNAPDGLQERQADDQAEMAVLYRWWTEALPALKARRKELSHALYGERRMRFRKEGSGLVRIDMRPFEYGEKPLFEELRELERRIDREEQEMLHRLVEIRPALS